MTIDHDHDGMPALERHCDVAVIGASPAALATALELTREHRQAIVIDDSDDNHPADEAPLSQSKLTTPDDVRAHGVEVLTGRALSVRARAGGGFEVALTGDNTLVARRVIVDSLAEAGWVERSSDPDDRRATVIGVTEAGLRQAEAVERVRRETSERFFGQLDPAERDALRRTLQGLLADGDHRSHRTERR